MSEQDKVVVVHFGNDHKITLVAEDPEAMLQSITNKESGWFNYENYAFRREHVTYAYITTPRVRKARATKPGWA